MKGKIVIIPDRCKGCGLCILFCPKKLIFISKKTNSFGQNPAEFVNSNECTGCGICALTCPDVAIEVYRNSAVSADRQEEKVKK